MSSLKHLLDCVSLLYLKLLVTFCYIYLLFSLISSMSPCCNTPDTLPFLTLSPSPNLSTPSDYGHFPILFFQIRTWGIILYFVFPSSSNIKEKSLIVAYTAYRKTRFDGLISTSESQWSPPNKHARILYLFMSCGFPLSGHSCVFIVFSCSHILWMISVLQRWKLYT